MMTNSASVPVIRIGGMEFLRPRAIPVLVTLLMVGMCLGLGIWQVQRLQWKEGLLAGLEAAQSQPPLTVADLPENLAELEQWNFYPIRLSGEYDHEKEYHVIGRSNSEEPGYHVLVPFRIAEDGRVLLVNRGWVPQHRKTQAQRREDPRPLHEEITGYVLVPQGGSRFLPDHDMQDNIWFWQDTERMAQESGLELPRLVIQRVDADQPRDELPFAKHSFDVTLRNDHFAYSLMWFSLAFSGLVIFTIYHRKPRDPQ